MGAVQHVLLCVVRRLQRKTTDRRPREEAGQPKRKGYDSLRFDSCVCFSIDAFHVCVALNVYIFMFVFCAFRLCFILRTPL